MNYDADYYERGIETGKSNYQNYRWIPELTIPMAMTIIDFLQIKPEEPILDFGCAKGYLVKALRMLHRDAWGYDISEYAWIKTDEEIKKFRTFNPYSAEYKYIICKDVLEHIPFIQLKRTLKKFNGDKLFTIVPLGEKGKYFAEANNKDITHIICENEQWWYDLFNDCGWICVFSKLQMKGIKESYKKGSHLFMVHERR